MKAYLLKVLILDHDDIGKQETKEALENARYPNRCISPDVIDFKIACIGEWHDDHPLNKAETREAEIKRLFPND